MDEGGVYVACMLSCTTRDPILPWVSVQETGMLAVNEVDVEDCDEAADVTARTGLLDWPANVTLMKAVARQAATRNLYLVARVRFVLGSRQGSAKMLRPSSSIRFT